MNKRELAYRKSLIEQMRGRWLVAIHVENHLNPGVPDLSYVMVADGHETGWLELKACAKPARVSATTPLKFEIEPSQHRWMAHYTHRVPSHFLIQVGDENYLVNGRHHTRMSETVTISLLGELADAVIINDERFAHKLATALSRFTRRGEQNAV